MPEITKRIEQRIAELQAGTASAPPVTSKAKPTELNPLEDYLNSLADKIDFAKIASAKLKLAYDPLWGTGRGYLDEALRRHGCEVTNVHDYRDVLFGGFSPEPSERNLSAMRAIVLEKVWLWPFDRWRCRPVRLH